MGRAIGDTQHPITRIKILLGVASLDPTYSITLQINTLTLLRHIFRPPLVTSPGHSYSLIN